MDALRWVPGRNPVLEVLKAGRRVERVVLARGARGPAVDALLRLASSRGVPVEWVDARELDRLCPGRPHQGVAARAEALPYVELAQVLGLARSRGEDPLVLALDGIQDQGNLGALLRVAEAAGAHGVVIPQRRAAGLGAGAARASAGAVEHVLVARVNNLARALQQLKGSG
ncbi:MAG: hypothetical protein K6T75_10005, partial [Acetobacteraceae bacterium]|nr:hypothetical protein [Acetobacteraceae bacterium]